MSEENVEVVRQLYEKFDLATGMDSMIELFDPDVEAFPRMARDVGGGRYVGHSGVRKWAEEMSAVWKDLRPEPVRFRDAGERVVVDVHWRAKGRASSVEIEEEITQVWWLRSGKVIRVESFSDRVEALEAAGLSD